MTRASDPAVQLSEVSLAYGTTVALRPCTVRFDRGEEVAIVGRSGSGKSSLLKLAGGLVNASSGTITSNGKRLTDLTEAQRSAHRAANVGFVYQDYNLISHLTVSQNVDIAWKLRPRHTTPAEAINAVGLTDRAHHRPSELSGGEQQRVSIARAVCGGPSIIFADEPTGALDDESTTIVIDLLRRLRTEFAITLVVVTHDRDLAGTFDRQISLAHGRIERDTAHG